MTCPQGAASSPWSPCTPARHRKIVVGFPAAACQACPARDQCTTSARYRAAADPAPPRDPRGRRRTPAPGRPPSTWKHRYDIRAGVEGTICQATHVTGIRRARYLGLAKTRLEHNAAAAAINLIRLDAWWTGKPLDRTRTTHLQRLDLAAAARPK